MLKINELKMCFKQSVAVDWLQFRGLFKTVEFLTVHEKVLDPEKLEIDFEELQKLSNNVQLFYYCLDEKDRVYLEFPKRQVTPNFANQCFVWMHGKRLGTLLYNPTNKIMMQGHGEMLILFKVANAQLYSKGWTLRVRRFCHLMKIEPLNISRVDIAVDTCREFRPYLDYRIEDIIAESLPNKKGNKKIQRVGQATISTGFSKSSIKYIYIGSRSSPKFVRWYNKSQEIKFSGKSYILDFWIENGVIAPDEADNKDKAVVRWEIVLTNSFLKLVEGKSSIENEIQASQYIEIDNNLFQVKDDAEMLAGMDIWKLEDPEYLRSWFLTAANKFIEFVLPEEDKRGRPVRTARLQRIDMFPNINATLLDKVPSDLTKDAIAAKRVINFHLRLAVIYGHLHSFEMIKWLLEKFSLFKWFEKTYPYRWKNLHKEAMLRGIVKRSTVFKKMGLPDNYTIPILENNDFVYCTQSRELPYNQTIDWHGKELEFAFAELQLNRIVFVYSNNQDLAGVVIPLDLDPIQPTHWDLHGEYLPF